MKKIHENYYKIISRNAHFLMGSLWQDFYFYSKIKPSELIFLIIFWTKNPNVRQHDFRHIKKKMNLDKLNCPNKVKSKSHATLQYVSLTLMY